MLEHDILAQARSILDSGVFSPEGLLNVFQALKFAKTQLSLGPLTVASADIAWAQYALPKIVACIIDDPAAPQIDLVASMLRCLGAAADLLQVCLSGPLLPQSSTPPIPDGEPDAEGSMPATAVLATAPAADTPAAHPALCWLVPLCRITDPTNPFWSALAHQSYSGTPAQGPKALIALATDMVAAGCVETAIGVLDAPTTPLGAALAVQQHVKGELETASVDTLSDGNHDIPRAIARPEIDSLQPSAGAPMAVDVVEGVLILISQLVTAATAMGSSLTASTLSFASKAVTRAVGRIPVKAIKRADAQRLVQAVQRLQLLVPHSSTASSSTAFASVVRPRTAIAAKALSSPILTIKLWAVKDLGMLISQAQGVGSADGMAMPLRLAEAICREDVPALLLGDMAHEEVLGRATPIFMLLLSAGMLNESTLRSLWQAPATKSSAVAAAATSVLSDVLRSPRCPHQLQIGLLDAVGVACRTHLTVGLASVLATLVPTYAVLPQAVSDMLPLLLWTLLSNLPSEAPPAAVTSLRATLLATLKAGSTEQRLQAIVIVLRPLQRACGVPVDVKTRPTHRRGGSQGSGASSSGSSGGLSSLVGILAGSEDLYAATTSGFGNLALAASGSMRQRPTELPPALAAAGDGLTVQTALELFHSIAELEPHRNDTPSLVALLEPRLNLMTLAQQLVATPITDTVASTALTCGGDSSIAQHLQCGKSNSLTAERRPHGPVAIEDRMSCGAVSSVSSCCTATELTDSQRSSALLHGKPQESSDEPTVAEGSTNVPSMADTKKIDKEQEDENKRMQTLASLKAAITSRLHFLGFVASELRVSISKVALEAAWAALPTPEAQDAMLLWLPSVLQSLSSDALAYGYIELLLRSLRWDTLSVREYEAFEALYRHYHVSKGSLRYATNSPSDSSGSALGFLSRLWRSRRVFNDGSAPHVLSRLVAEVVPSSLQGTQQLWLTIACAPEETAKIALPLLVQLHLWPAHHLDLCVVRQELLQGCFHALQRLTAQNAEPSDIPTATWRPEPGLLSSRAKRAQPPLRAQAQVRLLLELLDEFIRACGEARKVIPHQASWRGQSCALAVRLERFSNAPLSSSGWSAAANGIPSTLSGTQSMKRSAAATSTGPSVIPLTSTTPGATGGETGGGIETSNCDQGGGGHASGSEMRLEILVHDNLTLGLLRQRLKREIVAAGMPKVSYKSLLLLKRASSLPRNACSAASSIPCSSYNAASIDDTLGTDGNGSTSNAGTDLIVLEGEVRTLRELGVSDGHVIVARICNLSSPNSRDKLDSMSIAPRDSKPERKHAALPGVMISQSNGYMTCLFDVLRTFARCPAVIGRTWDLIMRVPTNAQRLAALVRPESVQWSTEMALATTQPMRLLYSLQIVRSRLLPAYLPEPQAPVVSAMAHWKASFMACGFCPLFRAFVALASSQPRDTLHATLLATSLAIVRASLVGYLHSIRNPSTRASRQPSGEPTVLLRAHATAATAPLYAADDVCESHGQQDRHLSIAHKFAKGGSVSDALLEGFSIRNLPQTATAIASNAVGCGSTCIETGVASTSCNEPVSQTLIEAGSDRDLASASHLQMEACADAAGASTRHENVRWQHRSSDASSYGAAVDHEARDFWELVRLLLRLMTQPASNGGVPFELQRQMALDQVKLLDAIICCHSELLPRFLALPELPHAISLSLLRAPHSNVRKQISLFLLHLLLEVAPSIGAPAVDTLLPQLEQLLPEAVAQPHASFEYFDLLETIVRSQVSSTALSGAMLDAGAVSPHHAHLCCTILMHTLPSLARKAPGGIATSNFQSNDHVEASTARKGRGHTFATHHDERVTLGLLRLLGALAATSSQCAGLLSNHVNELCINYLVTNGDAQPSAAVRHACLSTLQAACRQPSNLAALFAPLEAVHAANLHSEWCIKPASELRVSYVGLVNQGATCYMNATLQQLFMIPAFRDGLLNASPPSEQRTPIVSELQRMFAHLRDGLRPVYDGTALVAACNALPMTYEPFQQNDAAEFLMLLVSHLEDSLKGTSHASLIRTSFGGKLVQQVIWEDNGKRKVSERDEDFVTIQLEVKGHTDIAGGLQELVDGERLEGENAYQLDSGEKVHAQKRICLGELPSTLIIQLKRFHLDYETMTNIKLNSRFAFPHNLDLEPYTKKGLDARAAGRPASAPEMYELVGVLVHSGTSGYGHYFSYIRAREGAHAWQIFNDAFVGPFDESTIEENCYGGIRQLHAGHSTEMVQNGFLLFYRKATASPAGSGKKQHRRSGSAPPAGIRYSASGHAVSESVLPWCTEKSPQTSKPGSPMPFTSSPQPSPEFCGVAGGGHHLSPLRLPVSVTANVVSSGSTACTQMGSITTTPIRLPIAVDACGSAGNNVTMSQLPTAAEAHKLAVVESVHKANAQLLVRQHLYDPVYINFLLSLLQQSLRGEVQHMTTMNVGDPPAPDAPPLGPERCFNVADDASIERNVSDPDKVASLDNAWRAVPHCGTFSLPPLLQFEPSPIKPGIPISSFENSVHAAGSSDSASDPSALASAGAQLANQETLDEGAFDAKLHLQLVQLCCRFYFNHLIRLAPPLLEPHLNAGRGWLSNLEAACDAHVPAAVWVLHNLLDPVTLSETPESGTSTSSAVEKSPAATVSVAVDCANPAPESSTTGSIGSSGSCWLLNALFDCQSAIARTVMVSFITRVVQRVASAEVASETGARDDAENESVITNDKASPLPAPGHAAIFVYHVMRIGLPHAAIHWADALPFCELVRTLVLLPTPLGSQIGRTWLRCGALTALAAYIIGEAAIEMPEHLGEQIMAYPRPQRGTSPPRTTTVAANNEGASAILQTILTLLELIQEPAEQEASAEMAATTPPGPNHAVTSDEDLESNEIDGVSCRSSTVSTAVPVHDQDGSNGVRIDRAESQSLPTESISRRRDMSDTAAGQALNEPPSTLPLAMDVIGTAAFVNSAVHALLRANSEGTEALHRSVEICCRSSADRSAPVFQAVLAGMRSEKEAGAMCYATLFVHLLTKLDDELLPLRCSMAIKRPHGLLGLILELIHANPPDFAAQKAEELGASTYGMSSSTASPTQTFTESSRCYMCIRVLLDVSAASMPIAQWLEDVLLAEEVEVMRRWLKDASRTASLGRTVERSRFLGVARRRAAYERTEEQQAALDQLKVILRMRKTRGVIR